jgi:excisionase family DNA binding protein
MNLVHSIPEACALARAGRTALYQAINSGELVAHKRGKRTLIFGSDLQRWLDALPQIEVKHPTEHGTVSSAAQATSRAPAERKDIS